MNLVQQRRNPITKQKMLDLIIKYRMLVNDLATGFLN